MKDLTAEQIREIYMKLPQDLKEAILGVDSTETMRKNRGETKTCHR